MPNWPIAICDCLCVPVVNTAFGNWQGNAMVCFLAQPVPAYNPYALYAFMQMFAT